MPDVVARQEDEPTGLDQSEENDLRNQIESSTPPSSKAKVSDVITRVDEEPDLLMDANRERFEAEIHAMDDAPGAILGEAKKVEDVVARAHDAVEDNMTTAQTEQQLKDAHDELERLDKLAELAKVEDIVARAHMEDVAPDENESLLDTEAEELAVLQQISQLARDPLQRQAQELQHKLGCLEDEKAKLDDVIARAASVQTEAFQSDRSQEAMNETGEKLNELKDDFKKVSRSVDTALVAPLTPKASPCETDPALIVEEARTASEAHELADAANAEDCETAGVIDKFKELDSSPAQVAPGDSPQQVAIEAKVQAGEQSALSLSDAALADASIAANTGAEAVAAAEKASALEKEKDEILTMAKKEATAAMQDESVAEQSLEMAGALDADAEEQLESIEPGVESEVQQAATVDQVIEGRDINRAPEDTESILANSVVDQAVFLSRRRHLHTEKQHQDHLGSTIDELREAETLSAGGKERAEKAQKEAMEAKQLGQEAKEMANQLSRVTEQVEETSAAAEAAGDKARSLVAESGSGGDDDCDTDNSLKAKELATQTDNELSGLSASMGAIKGDITHEKSDADSVVIAADDINDVVRGDILEADCEESHQNAAEKAVAVIAGTSMHHVPHPCGELSAIACSDECATLPECEQAAVLPPPIDPCEEEWNHVAHQVGVV
eukprot:Blabericola_migrator_1__124@NODE_1030_length_5652_cov_194_902238_g710_i0_p1_GENE_NODE_1030_length_5652_cov_194_902238_g710_i0NODE_1030_length_5652_cov_194_902238_g710_i0_p1_ORF_typecomplete_len673_score153_22DUF2205/PF10224_9/2_5DUF2205/PF10224_9/1_9e03DUF2205/PF10224_9/30DUF948/PF06103_11/1_1e02DUF948/PF06103_11/2e03DUF948/PF06103_11/99DUF948/PF06103_11/0_89DUF948/PF06103_11/9_1e03Prominin/PF05478_11/10Prominin/PF05478_11/8_7_NODE_1030_length_5652_cov_194_902238_g710_i015123530